MTLPKTLDIADRDLVAAVRAGDDRAFELLFVRYRDRIGAYVRGMVGDHGRAEDITQDVFIAALRGLRRTDSEIAFKPWIYEIAKNACIDAFRRARVRPEILHASQRLKPTEDDRLAAPAADKAVETKLAIVELVAALGGLSPRHHGILVMREFEDLSYREIGERLGLSQAAVESSLFRARRRLSEEFDLVTSGERCARVREIIDAPDGLSTGKRDKHRMARHLSHCQPCRRYAGRAGVALGSWRSPVAERVAAWLPLPAFARSRRKLGDANGVLDTEVCAPRRAAGFVRRIAAAMVARWWRDRRDG